MKKIMLAGLLLALAACGNSKTKRVLEETKEEYVVLEDSYQDTHNTPGRAALVLEDEMGPVVRRHYTGTLPCADCEGIDYDLTLWNQQFRGTGTYDLITHYKSGRDDKDNRYVEHGNWILMPASSNSDSLTIVRVQRPNDEDLNFEMTDTGLVMLDKDMQRIQSEHNYTLRLRTDRAERKEQREERKEKREECKEERKEKRKEERREGHERREERKEERQDRK